MKTKLFIDFDGTMFDTAKFKNVMFNVFLKLGFNQTDIQNTYMAECMDYKYHIDRNLDRLMKIKQVDEKEAKEKIGAMFHKVLEYLFDDTIEVLRQIDKDKYELNMLTLGDEDFQSKKVKAARIAKYFDNIYYTEVQKWDYLKDLVEENEYFILVDDRGDTVENVKKNFPKSLPIEINRPGNKQDLMEQDNTFDGKEITNLKQLMQFL